MNVLTGDNTRFQEFSSIQEMIKFISAQTASILSAAIKARGSASYVAAGGSTVPPLFEALSNSDIDWEKVNITLSDDRWVKPSDPTSNHFLVTNTLLQNKASRANFAPLLRHCEMPEQAITLSDAAIHAIAKPFDVTLLGMGADMHVASLIPNAPGTGRALDTSRPAMVCKIGPVDGPNGAEIRLSLTLRAILESKVIFIMITGDEKLKSLKKASLLKDPTSSPVSAILHQTKCPVYVYWAPKP
ncbi:MAG: 6-phosphogluconolactonase [Robiginitomaculum sp.]